MIFFVAHGRLGNQVFQYAYLKTIQKNNEAIYTSGFDELLDVFEIKDLKNVGINRPGFIQGLAMFVYRLLFNLTKIKAITKIKVNYDSIGIHVRESDKASISKGLFPFVRFVCPGFFQSEKFFDETIAKNLKLKDKHLKTADAFLDNIPERNHRVFVHIRRGDYKTFKIYGKSTLLPTAYFHEQIAYFREHEENSFFIFLSDEPAFIKKEFSYLKEKKISYDNAVGTDIAIITKCDSGILSPSSFGWWGAYLMKTRKTVVAPEYWLGFNSRIEFQNSTFPDYAKSVSIQG